MPLILHGHPFSTCYARVLLTAAEAGVELETVIVDLAKGEHKKESYLEKQPFGKVPIFEDTDTGIEAFESRAICRYIAAKAKADQLIPTGSSSDARYLEKMVDFETAASMEYSSWDPAVAGLAHELLFKKPFVGSMTHVIDSKTEQPNLRLAGYASQGQGEPEEVIVQHHLAQLNSTLDGYERILSKQDYLAGDTFTFADLTHVPTGRYLFLMTKGDCIESRPNVSAWWKRVSQRESVNKVYGDLDVDETLKQFYKISTSSEN